MATTYSIVIPTHDRPGRLYEVLTALGQQIQAPPFEVIVVDDGSKDDVSRRGLSEAFPHLTLTVLRQESSGPASARNRGITHASGNYIALLGDDTVPASTWLAEHDTAHRARPDRTPLAVIGHTSWHPSIRQTAFLKYINEEGMQFGFSLIEDRENLPYTYFYGSNLSMPRQILLEEPFSPEFKRAAWEDTELGLRLTKKKHLQMVYHPQASVYHRHPTSFSSFSRRQYNVGRAAAVFFKLHPEVGPMVGLSSEGPHPMLPAGPFLYRSFVIHLCEQLNVPLPGLWRETLRYHLIRGLQDGWRDVFSATPPPLQP